MVTPDAVGDLGDTVATILSEPSYRVAARHMEMLIKELDGARNGASGIESVLDRE